MSETEIVIPEFVLTRFQQIGQLTGATQQELTEEYKTFWRKNDAYLHSSTFFDDEQRHRFCEGVLWAQYRTMKPTKDYDVVPVGLTPWKWTKRHSKRNSMYLANFLSDGKIEKVEVGLYDDMVNIVKTMGIGFGYRIKLTSETYGSGNDKRTVFYADRRTTFTNPQQVNLDLLSLYERLGALKVPDLASVSKYPSRLLKSTRKPQGEQKDGEQAQNKEFTDTLDWRIVRGFISDYGSGVRKSDESPWASYTIMDTSLGTEDKVDSKGNVIKAGFTLWLDEALQQYAPDSEIYAVGTISMDKNGQPQMNCINVLPIHVFPLTK